MKKHLCFAVSLILLITCTHHALANGFVFRKGISIGSSMMSVIANEKPLEHIWADDQYNMFYYINQTYMGEKCTVGYSFTNGNVSQIHVLFDDPSSYDSIEEKLETTYTKQANLDANIDKENFSAASAWFANDVHVFHYLSKTAMHVLSYSD